jgi:hypothetical protein
MLVGGIVGWEEGHDDLFNPNSPRNRDDCLEPFRVLRAQAQQKNIQLHTVDVLQQQGIQPDFTLYLESLPVTPIAGCKNYLVRFETELTVPINGDPNYLNQFDGIYTWDQDLINGDSKTPLAEQTKVTPKFAMRYPNVLPKGFQANAIVNPGFANRPIFCVLIASNRHANAVDQRELYSERVKAIRWFEQNAPKDFALYGNGWKVPQKRLGSLGKLQYRLEKIVPFLTGSPVFKSYQGVAPTKFEIYSKSKFSICFENARDIPGYITEKMFDCLFAGCVPIYWGEPAIESIVPRACFIDFREFVSKPEPYRELYSYIKDMSKARYQQYQQAGQDFLSSPQFAPFTSVAFAESILRPIES